MAPKNIRIVIQGDGESAKTALAMVREQMAATAEQAKHSGSEIGEAMERVKRALEYIGLYVGIREVAEGMKELVSGSIELGMEIGHLSKQTGITTENLSALKFMSDQTGVGFDVLTKGMKRFSVEMLGTVEGQKASIQAFARIGISQAEVTAHSKDMYGMLGLVADRFKALPDGPIKAAEAQMLFGRAGLQLIPILNQGKDAIDELKAKAESLGLVLSTETVERMEQVHEKLVAAEGAARGLGISLTDALAPALQNLAVGASAAIRKIESLIGLKRELAEDNKDRQTVSFNKIDPKVLGMSDEQRDSYAAAAAKRLKDAQAEQDHLEGLLNRKAISQKEYADRLLRSQKESDAAKLAQAQASVVALEQVAQEADSRSYATEQPGFQQYDSKGYDRIAEAHLKAEAAQKNLAGAYRTLMELQDTAAKPTDDDFQLQPKGTKAKKPQSDNAIAEALTQRDAEQAKLTSDARRALDEQNLAELEAQHRIGLVADGEFYTEKARLENDAFDAEQQSLRQHLAALQALETRQHADKGLKRDKAGNSAEELRTQKEMLQIQDQLAQVEARRGQKGSQDTAQADAGNKEAELARLKVAAELEKQRNDGITARLALLRREADIEAQKVHNAGGSDADVAQVRALEQIEEQKLQIEEVTRQITAAEQAHKLAVDAVQDAERKGLLTKRAGQQQINQLNRQEAATLQQLVAQYTALAQVLGGDYLQKARALQATLAQLGRPDNQSDNQFAKQIGQGLSGVIDKFADSAARGKQSFHSMTLSMLQDIEALAVKMATERWLTPLLTSAFGGAGGGSGAVPSAGPDIASALWESHASGGTSSDNAQVVGEKGPEIWQPPTRGGTILPTAAVRALGEGGGGGGRAPSITQNIINNSSQPVTAQAPQVSFDTQLKSYVINTVLEDHAQGGPIAQSMRGLGAG
jgi:lambda family phage tail tape measure protein